MAVQTNRLTERTQGRGVLFLPQQLAARFQRGCSKTTCLSTTRGRLTLLLVRQSCRLSNPIFTALYLRH